MRPNPMRAGVERGEVQIGTWVNMVRNPAILPLLKAAGLDFARVDMEHSSPSMETIADMALLARALDFPIAVRPPKANREWITRLLDVGVWNLHCPQVENRPSMPREIVAASRYAPRGLRGNGGLGPATDFETHGTRCRAPRLRQRAGVRDRDVRDGGRIRRPRRDRRDGRHRRAHARPGRSGAGPGRLRHARPGARARREARPDPRRGQEARQDLLDARVERRPRRSSGRKRARCCSPTPATPRCCTPASARRWPRSRAAERGLGASALRQAQHGDRSQTTGRARATARRAHRRQRRCSASAAMAAGRR